MQVFQTVGADFVVIVGADSVDFFAPDNAGGYVAHSPTRDKLEAFVYRGEFELVRQYISDGRVAEASYKLQKLGDVAADEIRQRCYIVADVIGVHHKTAQTVPPTHPEILAIPASKRGGTPHYQICSEKNYPKKIAQIKRYLWA